MFPVGVEEPAERWARRLGGAPRRRICFLRPTRREGARRRIRSAGRPACATARFGQRRHRINL